MTADPTQPLDSETVADPAGQYRALLADLGTAMADEHAADEDARSTVSSARAEAAALRRRAAGLSAEGRTLTDAAVTDASKVLVGAALPPGPPAPQFPNFDTALAALEATVVVAQTQLARMGNDHLTALEHSKVRAARIEAGPPVQPAGGAERLTPLTELPSETAAVHHLAKALGWPDSAVRSACARSDGGPQLLVSVAARLAVEPELGAALAALPPSRAAALLPQVPMMPTGTATLDLAALAGAKHPAEVAKTALAAQATVADVLAVRTVVPQAAAVVVDALVPVVDLLPSFRPRDTAQYREDEARRIAALPLTAEERRHFFTEYLTGEYAILLRVEEHGRPGLHLMGPNVPPEHRAAVRHALTWLPAGKLAGLGITPANAPAVAAAEYATTGVIKTMAAFSAAAFPLLTGPRAAEVIGILTHCNPDMGAIGFLLQGGDAALDALVQHSAAILALAKDTGSGPGDARLLAAAITAIDHSLAAAWSGRRLTDRITGRRPVFAQRADVRGELRWSLLVRLVTLLKANGGNLRSMNRTADDLVYGRVA